MDERHRHPVCPLRLRLVPGSGALVPAPAPAPPRDLARRGAAVPPGLPGGAGPGAGGHRLPRRLSRAAPHAVPAGRGGPAASGRGGHVSVRGLPGRLRRTVAATTISGNLLARIGALAALSVASLLVARTGGPAAVGTLALLRIL